MDWARFTWLVLVMACTGHERQEAEPEAKSEPQATEPTATEGEKPTIAKDWALEQRTAIELRMNEMEACFEQATKQAKEPLGGKMTLEVQLERGGNVTAVKLVEDTVDDQKMTDCVRARLLAWRLPVDPGIDPAPVTFTMVFAE
jgi:hypothetical protein